MIPTAAVYHLPIASRDFVVSSPLEVEAYCAGLAAYDAKRLLENLDLDIDIPNELPEIPTDAEFTTYLQTHQPKNLTPTEVESWRAYFMLGWYSRVFFL
jgi:hypothetical protein